MPDITVKAKPEPVYNLDDTPAYTQVLVPTITTRHCDMPAFRAHSRFGSFANSDLFPALLQRKLRNLGVLAGGSLRLDEVPDGVSVDTSGFLTKVTIPWSRSAAQDAPTQIPNHPHQTSSTKVKAFP